MTPRRVPGPRQQAKDHPPCSCVIPRMKSSPTTPTLGPTSSVTAGCTAATMAREVCLAARAAPLARHPGVARQLCRPGRGTCRHFDAHSARTALSQSGADQAAVGQWRDVLLWNALSTTGIIEGRGRALATITAPDLRPLVEEDIAETTTGHLNRGLFIAHGLDEGGDGGDVGAHDQMWFLARDLVLGRRPSGPGSSRPRRPARRRSRGKCRKSPPRLKR